MNYYNDNNLLDPERFKTETGDKNNPHIQLVNTYMAYSTGTLQ